MKHWFKDQHFRSLLRNSSYLGVSKIVAAVCGVATLAFAGRGLGVLLFGTLILITSYVKAVNGIAKFQSWQLIVRYGGQGIAHGDPEHFKVATGFAFTLDMISGIAGMLLAVALVARPELVLLGGEREVHEAYRDLGSPSTRSAMMLRRISEVPASIVLPRLRSCSCCQ